jgi:hypothetical protein
VAVFNLNRHRGTDDDIRTIATAFPGAVTLRCPPSANLVVVAPTSARPPTERELEARADRLDERFDAGFSFRDILARRRR